MIGKNFRVGRGMDSSHKGHKGHKAGGKKSGREAGGGNPQEHPEPRFADRNGLARAGTGIENHENHSADMETREGCGWNSGARATRPHFCRRKLIFIPTFHSTFSLANYA